MADRTLLHQPVSYRRVPNAPGLEIIEARRVPFPLHVFNVDFGITMPGTWQGDVLYERQYQSVAPGRLLSTRPGTTLAARRDAPGSIHVLTVPAAAFSEYLSQHVMGTRHFEWNESVQRPTPQLLSRLATIFTITGADASTGPLAIQSALEDLFESIASELVKRATPRCPRHSAGVAERMRERLHDDMSEHLDLQTFADAHGMSRFQVLRAFKRRYGLPPHTYQLCVKVTLAKALLKRGEPPADVAARLGFSDQSHFGRHFKRVIGVTPMHYVRAASS
jgi:AraC-like DNA-binding protein